MYKNSMNLDGKIFHEIPVKQDATKESDLFGLEVELEGTNVTTIADQVSVYWAPHVDHSLRAHNGGQAIEYVFHKPFDLTTTTNAVDLLFDKLNSPGVKVNDSYRTSIHVHLNFAIEPYRVIYNFMCLSFILDELLVSQNGDHRIGNNFCLRVKDAMGQMNSAINSIENGHGVFGIGQNERYSSINFASLAKFGSIEFRSLECTTHKGRLMHWINTLQAIKAASRTFKNPTEIIGLFSQMGPAEFLFKILGPYAMKYTSVPGYEKMLKTGMRIAQDFAYCSQWKPAVAGEPIKGNKKPKQKNPFLAPLPGQAVYEPAGNWALQPPGAQPVIEEVELPDYNLDDDEDDFGE